MCLIDSLISLSERLGHHPNGAYFFCIVAVLYGWELLRWTGCIVFIVYCLFGRLVRWLRLRRKKAVD